MSQLPLYPCIFLLIGSALAADVPFVFDETTSDVAGYTADRIKGISASSSDLAGIPQAATPSNDEILEFPITTFLKTYDGNQDHPIRWRCCGLKVSAVELEQIKQLVAAGVYLNTSDFVRDAIRDKLSAIKTIKYRDLDYDTAKKEVMGYFQERGEAYPSEVEEDLELDYELVCQITEELKIEGRLELL